MTSSSFAGTHLGAEVAERLVSVVIPTYNCAHFLSRALSSVVNQTYPLWEVLVIDNHSSDNTQEVVEAFNDPRMRLLRTHNCGVIAVSRNLGIREAKGEWVAFLDADDWWTPEKLELSIRALDQGHDFVYHDLVRVGPGKGWIPGRRIKTRKMRSPVFRDLLGRGNAVTNSSVVVNREVLVEAGALSENPQLVAAEDFECWIRIARKTERFFRMPDAHGYYWIGGGNVSSSSRTLTCLEEIRTLYCLPDSPDWLSFALGKAHFLLHQYELATKEFAKVLFTQASPVVYFKARLMALFSHAMTMRTGN
jgi:glycosyltransferase involved in cell wall biosynthesis